MTSYTYDQYKKDRIKEAHSNTKFPYVVGQRVEATLHVIDNYEWKGDLAQRRYITLVDMEGNRFQITNPRDTMEVGMNFFTKFTVKENKIHPKYGKQTILSRAKLIYRMDDCSPHDPKIQGAVNSPLYQFVSSINNYIIPNIIDNSAIWEDSMVQHQGKILPVNRLEKLSPTWDLFIASNLYTAIKSWGSHNPMIGHDFTSERNARVFHIYSTSEASLVAFEEACGYSQGNVASTYRRNATDTWSTFNQDPIKLMILRKPLKRWQDIRLYIPDTQAHTVFHKGSMSVFDPGYEVHKSLGPLMIPHRLDDWISAYRYLEKV
jgi:hypothetical protein